MKTESEESWWPLSWADVVASGVDTLEFVVAAALVALLTLAFALWKWKPQLRLEQSVSCRRVNTDAMVVAVVLRYTNTSSYRHIPVRKISVELRRLSPLAANEGTPLPTIPDGKQEREWSSGPPVLDPGETLTEPFFFKLTGETADTLEAFTVYTFIPEAKNPARGWVILTAHDVHAYGNREEAAHVR